MKLLIATAALLLPIYAQAERADRFEKTVIAFDGEAHYDTVKGVVHASDNVVLAKGTLQITADTLTVTESQEGHRTFTVTAAKNKLARFRQKQDASGDKWVQGEGKSIVYSEKDDVLTIDGSAAVKVTENGKVTDDVTSARIAYDARTEKFVTSSVSGSARVRSMITMYAQEEPLAKK